MSEQNTQINVRLINKYDTEENWKTLAGDYVAPAGELIISAPSENSKIARIRVGDGDRNISELPIINANANWTQSDPTAPNYIIGKPPVEIVREDNGNVRGIKVEEAGYLEAVDSTFTGKVTAASLDAKKIEVFEEGLSGKSTIEPTRIVQQGSENKTVSIENGEIDLLSENEGTETKITSSGINMSTENKSLSVTLDDLLIVSESASSHVEAGSVTVSSSSSYTTIDSEQVVSPKVLTLDDSSTTKSVSHYTNSTPTLVAIGGIPAGTTFENKHINDLLTDLLYPYVSPSNIVLSNVDEWTAGVYKNKTLIIPRYFKLEYKEKSRKIISVEVFHEDSKLVTISDENALVSPVEIDIGADYAVEYNNYNTYFVAKINDGVKTYTSNKLNYVFTDPIFIGTVTSDGTVVSSVEQLETSRTITRAFTTDNTAPFIQYPKSWGTMDKIVDPNGFSQTWKQSEVTINDVNYYQYVGDVSTAVNVLYTFTI